MPYALYPVQGNSLPTEIGPLKGGVAYQITQEQARRLKKLKNVIVFDKIAGAKEHKEQKHLFGVTFKGDEVLEEKTFQDFVSKHNGDMKKAAAEWEKWKIKAGKEA